MRKKTKLRHLISMLVMVLTLAVLISWGTGARAAVLHDNGPMVNSPGTHPGGGDESIWRQTLLGFDTAGFNASHNYLFVFGNAVADNFAVADGATWMISSFDLYAFQNGAVTPTIAAAYLRIWDGNPATGEGSVVWGDNTTNVLTSDNFTDIYIVLDTPGLADDSRRVQRVTDQHR